ncbi:MAG: cell wall hydrolase [Limnochordia bacterium]
MNWRMLLAVALIFLVGCGSPGTSPGGSVPGTGSLTGSVRDSVSGFNILDGEVRIDDQVVPIRDGAFQISGLNTGTYTMTVTKDHYEIYRSEVRISRGSNYVEIALKTKYSHKDLELLARLVRAEAEGEPFEGQIAVAASVLRRVLSKAYPNTISGVVYEQNPPGTYQFEPVLRGTINNSPNDNAWAAVWHALAGNEPAPGATGFYNPRLTTNKWVRQQPVIKVIGKHVFFRTLSD